MVEEYNSTSEKTERETPSISNHKIQEIFNSTPIQGLVLQDLRSYVHLKPTNKQLALGILCVCIKFLSFSKFEPVQV